MPIPAGELFAGHSVADTSDLDQARRVLSDVFLPLDFSAAQPPTALPMVLNVVKVAGVTLGYVKFSDVVTMHTTVGTNYHVVVPTSGSAVFSFPSRMPLRATTRTAIVFSPGMRTTMEFDSEFSHLSIVFPRAAVRFELQAILGRDLDRPIAFAWELDLDSPESEPFLEALRLIDTVSQGDGAALRQPLAALRLEQVLIHSLLFTQPNTYSELLREPPVIIGSRYVKVAVDQMQDDPARPWTLAELAAAASVSTRTLQADFRRTLATTPMRYLRRIRLERVYEDLSLAEPDSGTVSQVAARWGFSHLGHFGAFYAERFGETPSDTLRRSRGRG